jgi:hypothetical protein
LRARVGRVGDEAERVEAVRVALVELGGEERLGDERLVDHVLNGRGNRRRADRVDRWEGEAEQAVRAFALSPRTVPLVVS